MSSSYSSYQGINPFYITLFDRLWERYKTKLPLLPTDIQSQENTKAAVFNLWVNFYEVREYLIIKIDKTFSHTFEDHLVKRLNMYVPQNLRPIIQTYRTKHHHSFLYSYFLTLQVLNELTVFVSKHEAIEPSMLKKYSYYYIDDSDVAPDADLYLILKILNYEFLQIHLTQQNYEDLHEFAYNEMHPYLNESI